MKITGIEIGEYRQFKNIKFDFTYPEGHAKAGQPLDKVCFIGQSGTGKTTLLNIIWGLAVAVDQVATARGSMLHATFPDNHLPEFIFKSKFFISHGGEIIEFNRQLEMGRSDIDFLNNWFLNKFTKTDQFKLIDIDKLCIFIKDSIASEADAFLADQEKAPQSFSDFVKTDTEIEQEKAKREERIRLAGRNRLVSLGERRSMNVWRHVLSAVFDYDETGKKFARNIIHESDSSVNILIEKLLQWKKNVPNPRIELAENCLNPILNNFFLEMDIDSAEVPVVMKTKRGIKIDSSYLSTGIRQLLSTAIPIYKFNTQDTVILFDEPERSLFPDIQRGLIDYYTALAPEAQFFFATHSPIVASAFEPCERFILYFDENGEVNFHNGVAPEGDDPNDILRQDFDMSPLMLEKGLEEYQRYLDLATKIMNEPDTKRKMELIAQRAAIGNKYNFSATNETN